MRTKVCLVAFFTLFGLGGCGEVLEENSEEDQVRARKALLLAIDTWKSGQTGTLARRDPPIRFRDDDQIAGLKLTEYELIDPAVAIHPFCDVGVTLTLQDRSGKTIRKPVTYQVGLEPNVTVLRSDN